MDNLIWYGHASFGIIGNKQIYIDPFMLPGGLKPADIIFVTHAHPDHLSPEDIKKLLKEDTIIVAPPDCLSHLEIDEDHKVGVVPMQDYSTDGLTFTTLPAYNTDPAKLQFHPRANNWVGYVLFVDDLKIYHAGDTDYISEMDSLANEHLDIALLPMGGTYTMDEPESARAANAIKAKITIPMHYKRLLGDKASETEEAFKRDITESKVMVLPEAKSV